MQVEQSLWTESSGWQPSPLGNLGDKAQLVLLFGSPAVLKLGSYRPDLKQAYPKADVLGCSTAGEICGVQVTDESLVATAIHFEQTQVRGHAIRLEAGESSLAAGDRLGRLIEPEGLAHVLLLSDGLHVNGSDLVRGILPHLPAGVTVTGGLSGDGDRFQETCVIWNGAPEQDIIAALGLYSDRLQVGYGSQGGWSPFGPERVITKSSGNVLYELDGQPALELYKKYLGDHAEGLPATGLLFPLSLQTQRGDRRVVRTILSVDEATQSLTFAGDVPNGVTAQLMHSSVDRLIDGAIDAAETSHQGMNNATPELAILISCVGRKLLMRQRIEEEVEGVRDVLGTETVLAGFYSYGEIAPFARGATCELHNQTMTITTFAET
ncbi:MAG: hypothetical protein DCF22_18830 [Leptolyngbya sp.]|nr:MAG: hypothetical protein DCF22_18830 [Leptolyngbya sp.]